MLEKSESEIIKGCLAGNAFSQRIFYRKFSEKMFLVCLRYNSSREEAEDVLQEGFMIAFEKLYQFKGEGSLEGWLKRIMIHKSLERARKSKYMFSMHNIEEAEYDFVSTEDILSNIALKDMERMIHELPHACRMVFNLYVFEGMKHKEIAEFLGVSENTSKSNLSYARELLKAKIAPRIILTRAINA